MTINGQPTATVLEKKDEGAARGGQEQESKRVARAAEDLASCSAPSRKESELGSWTPISAMQVEEVSVFHEACGSGLQGKG